MRNSYPEGQNFQFAPNNRWILFLANISFDRCLNMDYFINLTPKFLHLRPKNVRFSSYLQHWHRNDWWKLTSKLMSNCQKDVLMSYTRLTRVVLHLHVRRHFFAPVIHKEVPVRYARNDFPHCSILSSVISFPLFPLSQWRYFLLIGPSNLNQNLFRSRKTHIFIHYLVSWEDMLLSWPAKFILSDANLRNSNCHILWNFILMF